MSEHSSAEYHRSRERRERALAAARHDPAIGAIHAELADRYSKLIEKAELNRTSAEAV